LIRTFFGPLWLAGALTPIAAHAALLVEPVGSSAQVGFDAHPVQELTLGPVTLNANDGRGVVFTAAQEFGAAGFSGLMYGLGSNGLWKSADLSFAWANGSNDGGASSAMRFTFVDGPVSFVGGFMNYVPSQPDNIYYYASDFVLKALAQDGTVLEQYELAKVAPIVTPDALNAVAYRGIARGTADIYAFEIQGAGVVQSLTFSPLAVVPEPANCALMLAGLTALALAARRRKS